MIELINEGMRSNVVALSAHGKVTHEDYKSVVIPAIEEKLKAHSKLRLFFQLGDNFEAYTVEAMWDDTKVGLRYLTAFEKISVVTNVSWIKQAINLFRIFVPCPVKLFRNEDLPMAAAWVNE